MKIEKKMLLLKKEKEPFKIFHKELKSTLILSNT